MADTRTPLRLGTRGSQLALYQARTVQQRIADAGGPPCEITIIKTSGDRLQDAPLSEIGGKRLFVKEIEDSLIAGEVDLAVHSSKDMPAILPDGLAVAGVLPREDPRDAVVLRQLSGECVTCHTPEELLASVGEHPSIGTSSVRRVAQLTRLFPHATFQAIRGNLDTRLRKLDAGDYDFLVLAAAGLRRLGFAFRISLALPPEACVPAPGQGIIAIEVREDDNRVRQFVTPITDANAEAALNAERALVEALGGGCQTPIGALATPGADGWLDLIAVVVTLDGDRAIRASGRAPVTEARLLGQRVAAQLIADGATEILESVRR